MLLAPKACDVGVDLEFTLATVVVHVPDLAEDRALSPTLVMDATDGPHAA